MVRMETGMHELLNDVAIRASKYLASAARRVSPHVDDVARLESLGGPLADSVSAASDILPMLDDIRSGRMGACQHGSGFKGAHLRWRE